MREILFRAKIRGSNAWVEGNLVNCKWWFDASPITVMIPNDAYLDPRDGRGPVRYVEVIPETVGQFTGLLDKNSRRIFEGDILRCTHCGEIRSVVFDEEMAAFEFDKRDPVENPDGSCLCVDHRDFEVIGNIHDNPEMVE